VLLKVAQAYAIFRELIILHAVESLLKHHTNQKFKTIRETLSKLPAVKKPESWINVGGQLIPEKAVHKMLGQIVSGRYKSWKDVHQFYEQMGAAYDFEKMMHAFAVLKEVHGIDIRKAGAPALRNLLLQSIGTREWMTKGIYDSRAKDYSNEFRQMVYSGMEEMNQVIGKLEDNSFIKQEMDNLKNYKSQINKLIRLLPTS
jgi:hypothetical protein